MYPGINGDYMRRWRDKVSEVKRPKSTVCVDISANLTLVMFCSMDISSTISKLTDIAVTLSVTEQGHEKVSTTRISYFLCIKYQNEDGNNSPLCVQR